MNINVPDNLRDGLARQATLNGFASPEDFAASLLAMYADAANAQGATAIEESVAVLERSHQEAIAGKTIDLGVAVQQIAERHGLNLER